MGPHFTFNLFFLYVCISPLIHWFAHGTCDFPTSSTSSFLPMHPNFSQSSLLFSLILFLLSHHFPCSLCLDDFHHSNCTSPFEFECGYELGKIEYPFWVSGHQAEYCGHPLFKLYCEGEHAIIEIKSRKYKVLNINPTDCFYGCIAQRASIWRRAYCLSSIAAHGFNSLQLYYVSCNGGCDSDLQLFLHWWSSWSLPLLLHDE